MLFTTVAQKLHQGTTAKTGCFPCPTASFRRGFRVAFFVSFLAKQKRKDTGMVIKKISIVSQNPAGFLQQSRIHFMHFNAFTNGFQKHDG